MMEKKKAFVYKNLLLLVLVIALAILPFLLFRHTGFQGTDDRAMEAIKEAAPGYKVWRTSLLKPGPMQEKLLFALQGALGAGFIGFYFWRNAGRAKNDKGEI